MNKNENTMESDDLIYNKITDLSEQGDRSAEKFKLEEAISKYEQALELLPKPIYIWEAAAWLYAAIGDAYLIEDAVTEYAQDDAYWLRVFSMSCGDAIPN